MTTRIAKSVIGGIVGTSDQYRYTIFVSAPGAGEDVLVTGQLRPTSMALDYAAVYTVFDAEYAAHDASATP